MTQLTQEERRRLWLIDSIGSPKELSEIRTDLLKKEVNYEQEQVLKDLSDLVHKGLAQKLRSGKWVLT